MPVGIFSDERCSLDSMRAEERRILNQALKALSDSDWAYRTGLSLKKKQINGREESTV